MKDTLAPLRFLARLSHLYEGRFLQPLWNKYPNHENNDLDALTIFLEGYAFARQGAPNDFIHAASDTIQQLRESGKTLTDGKIVREVWRGFCTLLQNSDLNYANNPLCPKGTEYMRNYRGESRVAHTSRLSAPEFLTTLTQKTGSANIIAYAKRNLEQGQLKEVYYTLSRGDGINGIGGKIASFFLRDVATFYNILPSKDRHLLQPVDVWVRRTSAQLMGAETSDDELARWIVREAAKGDINPEAINQGIWYFGSQIGGSEYRVSCALNDLGYARTLVDEHIEAIRLEVLAWEQIQKSSED